MLTGFSMATKRASHSVNARKKSIYVSYPNGKLEYAKRIFIFWSISPKVNKGGTIHVNKNAAKKRVIKDRKPLDWNQVVATISSAAMGFGTIYALISRS